MPERWVNAVIKVVIPLDVPVGSTSEAKGEALERAMEDVGIKPNWSVMGRWEDVEDGEPLTPAKTGEHRG